MQPSVKKSGASCGAEIGFDLAQDIDDPTFREIERISTTILSLSFGDSGLPTSGTSNSALGLVSWKFTS
jgi:hypothetical protein